MKGTNRLRKPGSVKKHLLGRMHSASEVFDYNLNKTQEEINEGIKDIDAIQDLDIDELNKKSVKVPNEYLQDVGSGNKSNKVTVTGFSIPVPMSDDQGAAGSGPGQMSAYFIDKYLKDEWDEVLNTVYTFTSGNESLSFYFDGVPAIIQNDSGDGSLSITARAAILSSYGGIIGYRILSFSTENTKTFNVNSTSTEVSNFPAENIYKKNIPIIDHQSSVTSLEIEPDQYHRWGEMASLTIDLGGLTPNGNLHEYMFEFQSGATPTTLSLPSSLIYGMKGAPTIKANTTYEFHIQQGKIAWEAYPATT